MRKQPKSGKESDDGEDDGVGIDDGKKGKLSVEDEEMRMKRMVRKRNRTLKLVTWFRFLRARSTFFRRQAGEEKRRSK
jgi:hypothetical protein